MYSNNFLKDLCELSELAYLDKNNLEKTFFVRPITKEFSIIYNCKFLKFIHTIEDCQLYICKYNDTIIVIFRGTESLKDVLADIHFTRDYLKLNKYKKVLVHKGFLNYFNSILDELETVIFNNLEEVYNIIFTGHSLGGALATLASCYFSFNYKQFCISCVTFGSPRVGSRSFVNCFNKNVEESYRLVNEHDPIPNLPSSLRFSHVKGFKLLLDDIILDKSFFAKKWRVIKNIFFSIFSFRLKFFSDHKCKQYIKDLELLNKCNN